MVRNIYIMSRMMGQWTSSLGWQPSVASKNQTMGSAEQIEIIRELMPVEQPKQVAVSKMFYRDLEIWTDLDSNPRNSVFSRWDYTKTSFGQVYLRQLLTNPLHKVKDLRERQQMLRNIMKLPDNRINQLQKQLGQIRKRQDSLLWLWKQWEEESQNYIDSAYFQGSWLQPCNKSVTLLRLLNYYKIIYSPLMTIVSPLIYFVLPYLLVRLVMKVPLPIKSYFRLMFSSNFGNMFSMLGKTFQKIKFLTKILWGLFYVQSIYASLEVAYQTHTIINLIHRRLNNISLTVREILALGKKWQQLFRLPTIDNPFPFLLSKTYRSRPRLLSDKGRILCDYHKLLQTRSSFRELFFIVGKIDGWLSVQRLLEQQPTGYSLAKFRVITPKNGKSIREPLLKVKKGWHPYLDPEKVVTNSIHLGGRKKPKAIITGPNAGGKSTFIKALSISVLLAQTLTISCCQSLSLTPFYHWTTYLNIPDCKGKESLFEAEMRRSLDYITRLKTLQSNQFSFSIMDEIFNSTNVEEGIAGAYAIARTIGQFPGINLITTHFTYLTRLARDTDKFSNYQIPISRNKLGNIIYPYRLRNGVCRQFIALELLAARGLDPEVIKYAESVCSTLIRKETKTEQREEKVIPYRQCLKSKRDSEKEAGDVPITETTGKFLTI